MNHSVKIALWIAAALSVYMLTGLIGCGKKDAVNTAGGERPLMTVQISEMVAEEIAREITVTGKTMPSRSVDLKAETEGRVVHVEERRGMLLATGDVIARIEMTDRQERLEQAKATLETAQLEYEAALRLQDRGLQSASHVAEALSTLRGAEQEVRFMELDIANTEITAPFDGILQDRMVEVGDYLKKGDSVARFIDLNPLTVEGEVTEFQIQHVRIGEKGHAHLASGEVVEGWIRYVAGQADAQAHTFTVELEVPNPEQRLLAGITAEIRIETERVKAYRISPGLISIADDGRFGVKIVDETNHVQFVEADIVRSDPDALWLSGLPEQIRLITIGQGFTQTGDRVAVQVEGSARE